MSSKESKRARQTIDYKVYSETGRKAIKESKELDRIEKGFKNLSVMVSHKLIDEERKVCLKFSRLIVEYKFDLLFDVEDIEVAFTECRKLLESYEDIHLELQRELEDEYEKTYKEFAVESKTMSDWIKKAKLEIKRRKEENVRLRMEEIEDQIRREIEERLQKENEEKEFTVRQEKKRRIQQDIPDVMDEGNTSVDDILRNVNNIKELRRHYLELNARIDNVFGNEYEDEFLQIHNEQNKYINVFNCYYKSLNKIDLLKLHLLKKMKRKNLNEGRTP